MRGEPGAGATPADREALAATVIIPSRDRPAQLTKALRALAHQIPVTGGFEVLVVDDGSEPPLDGPALVAASGLPCRVLRTSNHGPAAARNLAAHHARGRLLAFTDDDCEPDPTWLHRLLLRHGQQSDPRIIGGRIINRLVTNPFAATSQNLITIGYAHQNRFPERARFFASNNLSVPRRDFLLVGGFDERFRTAEDRDLCDRWIHSGRTMTFAPECRVHHSHAMGLSGFWRQHFAYGRGACCFHLARRKRYPAARVVEWPYYRMLLRSTLPPGGRQSTPSMLFALAVSQWANLLGFLWELAMCRSGWARWPLPRTHRLLP